VCTGNLGQNARNALDAFMDSGGQRLLGFYASCKMKRDGIFSKDRIPEITAFYGVAGLALRTNVLGLSESREIEPDAR
jgi:hypothetical protein